MFLIDPRRPADRSKRSSRRPNRWDRTPGRPVYTIPIFAILFALGVVATTWPSIGVWIFGAVLFVGWILGRR